MPQTRMTIKIGSFTGSLTNESNIITNVDNTEQLGSISFSVGDIVKGPSIPANTRISEIGTGSITLTNDATNTIANAIFVVLSDDIQVKDATTLNGMTFDEISESAVAAGADGEIQFNDNSSLGASSNLYWDNTDNRLGIGTISPTEKLEVNGNIKADIFKGDLQGTADKIKAIRDEATDSAFFPTFVDSNNETATSEELYTNSKLYYNPLTGTLYIEDLNISGDLTVGGSVSQVEIEDVYTSNDHIFLREGAVSGLGVNQYAGLIAQNADGTNDSGLVFNGNGIARIGDISYSGDTLIYDDTQAIATREDSPTDTALQF
jgi:hypothetical protein